MALLEWEQKCTETICLSLVPMQKAEAQVLDYFDFLLVYDSQAGINGWQCLMQCLVEKNLERLQNGVGD